MFKRVLFILICLAATAPTFAAEDKVLTNYPPSTEALTGKQVLQLPQDENKLYLTLYGNGDDERFIQLKKWFNENAELKAIRAQTHYAAIDTNSKLFKDRYADEIDSASQPCIRVVTPGGLEVLRIDGNAIPMSDASLNKGLRTGMLRNLFGGNNQQGQKHKGDRMNPKDRFDKKIDEKIDEHVDNANLPPIASAVAASWAKTIVHTLIGIVIFIVATVAVVVGIANAVKQTHAS